MPLHKSKSFASEPPNLPNDAHDDEIARLLHHLADSSQSPKTSTIQTSTSSMTRNETHAYPTESTTTSQDLPDGYHDWALWLSTVFGPPTPLSSQNFPLPTKDRGKALQRHRPYVTFNSALQRRRLPQINDRRRMSPSHARAPVSPNPSTLDGSSISSSTISISDLSTSLTAEDPLDDLFLEAEKSTYNTAPADAQTIDSDSQEEGVDSHDDSDACSYYTASDEFLSTSHHEQQRLNNQRQSSRRRSPPVPDEPRPPKRHSQPTKDPVERPQQQQCHTCHQMEIPQSTLESLGITKDYIINLATTKHKRLKGFTGRGKAWDPATFIECPHCKLKFHCGCQSPPVRNYPSRFKEWHCDDCLKKLDEEIALQKIPVILPYGRRNIVIDLS